MHWSALWLSVIDPSMYTRFYEAFASGDCSFIEASFASPRPTRRSGSNAEAVERQLPGLPRCRKRHRWSIDLQLRC
jgi:hypothetical protein